jgi:predicted helicase
MNIEEKPSLDTPFDQIGGEAGVQALVTRFYDLMIDELGQLPAMNRGDDWLIAMPAARDFRCLATDRACDFHFIGDSRVLSLYRYDEAGTRQDNITDWTLKQFTAHYKNSVRPEPVEGQRTPSAHASTGSARTGAGKAKNITKEAIFHYCYAVLHDPL